MHSDVLDADLTALDELASDERWDQAMLVAGRILSRAGSTGDAMVLLNAHYQRARALVLGGHPVAAVLDSTRAAELAGDLGRPDIAAQTWLGVAQTRQHLREFAEAAQAYERALEAALGSGDAERARRAQAGRDEVLPHVAERDRLVAAVRARLDRLQRERSTTVVLSADATRDAAALRQVAGGWPPDFEARSVLGAFHYCRWVASGRQAGEDLASAMVLYGPLREAPEGTLPDELLGALVHLHELSGRGIDLAEAAERRHSRTLLDEAEGVLRSVVSATMPGDLALPDRLSNLGIVLLTRFELIEDLDALAESVTLGRQAVDLTPLGDPSRPVRLTNLGNSLQAMHEATGDPGTAREAVEAGREALRHCDPLTPRYSGWLSNLSLALRGLASHTWDLGMLEEAIALGRDAVRLAWPDDGGLPGYRSNLANALLARSEHVADVGALREAAEQLRLSVDETETDAADRFLPERLSNLSNVLLALHETADDPAILSEAVAIARRAAALVPADSPAGATCTSVLSEALRDSWLRHGRQADLDEAVDLARSAIAAGTIEKAGFASHLMGLALTLKHRFDAVRDLAALDEAIELQRRAASNPRLPAVVRAGFLSNVANALRLRDTRDPDAAMLNEALRAAREAVALIPDDHPARPGLLSNLALVLHELHDRSSDPEPLAEAIALLRLAVGLAAPDDPGRPSFLSNLARALLSAARPDDPGTLAESIQHAQRAVESARSSDSARGAYLSNLGHALRARYERGGDDADRREAARRFGEASAQETAPVSDRIRAAQAHGQLEVEAGRWAEASAAYRTAAELLPRVATRRLGSADQQHELGRFLGLVSEAAAVALENGDAGLAVELLEQGRGILLTQSLEPRGDLSRLRELAPDLSVEFERLRDELDRRVAREAGTWQTARWGLSQPGDHRHKRSREWDALLARIRAVGGDLERFLLPATAGELGKLAAEGPIVLVNVSHLRSDAIVLTTGGLEVVRLPALTPREVAGRTAMFLAAVDAIRGAAYSWMGKEEAVETLNAVLVWLWDAIAGPVLRQVPGHGASGSEPPPRLWWCPTSLLSFLPLHAAGRHHETPGDGSTPDTVMDRVVSSYTPTLGALAHARTARIEPSAERWALIVAMPDPTLGAVNDEARAVEAAFHKSVLLVGTEAGKNRVLAELEKSSWAHFACHAISDIMRPASSGLCISGGLLTVENVVGLRVQAELAFLSACRTVASSVTLPDEALHIASAFQIAGFPQVVGTLWPVADGPAATIAVSVYERMSLVGVPRALHAALHEARWRHAGRPFFWAAHVHVGA